MSNLTKTLAVISLLAPASGHTLGIGNIKLHSALNQNLNAEISLVVSAGEKASNIKVNLAPPDKFDEAGVPWSSFLSKIRFTTIVGANGSVIIKLSSREAVKEPFLDFLLEVNWPKGSLYREFTVLLDPPTAYKQATLPVLTSPDSYYPEQALSPQHQPKKRQSVSAEPSSSRDREYGPTRKNDTLWKVAERASRQEGVSVEQMMIAMYEENPHAFFNENVHSLLAGKTLKIPEKRVVLRFSRKQALAEYNRQTKVWKNRLSPAPIETASAKKDTRDNQLTLVAPTEADVTENVTIAPENGLATAKKKIVDSTTPKTIDKEVASVVSPVNDALQEKVVELEKQLAMMQQILALKDQQLAALQNQPQAKPVTQAEPVQTAQSQTDVENPVIQQKPAQSVTTPVIQQEPEATSSSSNYYLWVGGAGTGILSMLGWLWWRKRKLDKETDSQSLFASSVSIKSPESKVFFSGSTERDSIKNVHAVGASSLFSEFAFDDFDTDQNEIDPVSEADVYLAYGRYQQAEELMRDVIKDQPDRNEYKLKLLEIFYSNENKLAFQAYANELVEAGKNKDIEFWAKVSEMGSEICQDSALFLTEADELSLKKSTIFQSNIANRVESDQIKSEDEIDINESGLSLFSFKESLNNEDIEEMPHSNDCSLNYNQATFEDEDIDEQQNNESIEFDLSTFAIDHPESTETDESFASKTQEVKGNDEFEAFEFDLSSSDMEIKESDESSLNLIGDNVESYQGTDFLSDKSSRFNYSFADDLFSGDSDYEFEKPAVGLNGQDFDQQDKFDVFDLTDMDQLETKLDLAKAYIDMSDADAAKDMAWEVLEKGTAEQKKIAQSLLNDLK